MRLMPKSLTALAVTAAAIFSSPVLAQSTWTFATFAENAANAGTVGNSWASTSGTTKLTVSAYSTTGASSAIQAANLANYGSGSGFGVRNSAEIAAAGGVVGNVTSPQHSMDNYTHTDFLALNFTNTSTAAAVSVVMTQLATGWHNTSTTTGLSCGGSQLNCVDSDISLLRWTGAGGPTITGGSIASLLTAGWSLVNNYADMVDDANRNTGATNAQSSSWWLISAYNSAWGTGTNTTNLSNGDDFVKVLSSITATPSIGTPEPGSLALAGLALFGVFAARRKTLSK